MKITALVAAVSLLLASVVPATAQSAGDGRGDPTRREQLSREFVELQYGDSLRANVQMITQQSLEMVAEMGADEYAEYRRFVETHMPAMLMELLSDLAEALIPIYAEAYSEDQLESLVAFYGSPMGREISQINMQTAVAQGQALETASVSALTNWFVKLCNEFDCEDDLGAIAPSRSNK